MLLTLTRQLLEYKGNSFICRRMDANSHPREVSLTCGRGRSWTRELLQTHRLFRLSQSIGALYFTAKVPVKNLHFYVFVTRLLPIDSLSFSSLQWKIGAVTSPPDRRYHDNCGFLLTQGSSSSSSRLRCVISSFYYSDIPAVIFFFFLHDKNGW